MLKLLHTSDWHIGRTLHSKRRYDEFESFLDWLLETIRENAVDVLVVAGDIFDTMTPSNRSQGLYYSFLSRLITSPCRHVVIVAGNHDSPSFLSAPKALLRSLNIHVVGEASQNPEDEVLTLYNGEGVPELIVCAVPYLRDGDVRVSDEDESPEERSRRLIDGIRNRYHVAAAAALHKREAAGVDIPIVATGHLFTAGGRTVEGDGVRDDFAVGTIDHVPPGTFPESLDYLALGHLHVPQMVAGRQTMRYSGSPIAMGFGEAGQEKSVSLVEFQGRLPVVRLLSTPIFRALESLRGDRNAILRRIDELVADEFEGWIEIIYQSDEPPGDLSERVKSALGDARITSLRTLWERVIGDASGVLESTIEGESLGDLNENDVFERCLDAEKIAEERRPGLRETYLEALNLMRAEDRGKE